MTSADPPPQEPTVVVRLRYRPAADVLVGEVAWPAPGASEVVEDEPDADTRMVWARAADGSQRLIEFLVIRAAERLAAQEVVLPEELRADVVDLVTAGSLQLERVEALADRLRVQIDRSVTIAAAALQRP